MSLYSSFRMDHGDRGMGVSHLRYEDEEGECVCAIQLCATSVIDRLVLLIEEGN